MESLVSCHCFEELSNSHTDTQTHSSSKAFGMLRRAPSPVPKSLALLGLL